MCERGLFNEEKQRESRREEQKREKTEERKVPERIKDDNELEKEKQNERGGRA